MMGIKTIVSTAVSKIPVVVRKTVQIGASVSLITAGAYLLYKQGFADGGDAIVDYIIKEPITQILRESDGEIFQFVKE